MDDVLLTVNCCSYNFGKFLRDAFEGFVNQKTSFKYKVFVLDDASTDNSAKIISEYENAYPDIFESYLFPHNTWDNPERNRLRKEVSEKHLMGKYIAECEGDDYWIDEYKLQKQVDFLENHPECSMVTHPARWMNYTDGTEKDVFNFNESRFLTAEEIILQPNGSLPTASYVCRRDNYFWPDSYPAMDRVWDYPRELYELSLGKIYYMNEIMSMYRSCHDTSWTKLISSDLDSSMKNAFELYEFLEKYNTYTKGVFGEYIRTKEDSYMYDPMLMNESYNMKDYFCYLDSNRIVSDKNRLRYDEGRKRIGGLVRGEYALADDEMKMYREAKHIVIYGCGDYSKYVRRLFESNNIAWEGYVVSGSGASSEFEGKRIWNIKDYPHSVEDTLFVIGVGVIHYKSIIKVLKEIGAERISAPLVY